MQFLTHKPSPPLAGHVDWLWFYEGLYPPHQHERVLPDGSMELIVNLRDEPRHVFDSLDLRPVQEYRGSWISGAHSRFIVIDTAPNSSMIGVHFKPGGAAAVLGFPASELRNQVVDLAAIFKSDAPTLRDQLLSAPDPARKFALLEKWLVRRWGKASRPHPAVTYALDRFTCAPHELSVSQVTREIGISRRHFAKCFTEAVGLTPKFFCRVRRFQQALASVRRKGTVAWAEVALAAGYYDQAHFIHDFREFCGLTPTRLAETDIEYPNFVPITP